MSMNQAATPIVSVTCGRKSGFIETRTARRIPASGQMNGFPSRKLEFAFTTPQISESTFKQIDAGRESYFEFSS